MRYIIVSLFFIFCGLISCDSSKHEDSVMNPITINNISFELSHPLRIPSTHLKIDLNKNGKELFVHFTSSPKYDNEMLLTKEDTTFKIDTTIFNDIISCVAKFSRTNSPLTEPQGYDGTKCEIDIGNGTETYMFNCNSPDSNTEKRRLTDFLNATKLIIRAAKLNPTNIL